MTKNPSPRTAPAVKLLAVKNKPMQSYFGKNWIGPIIYSIYVIKMTQKATYIAFQFSKKSEVQH